jgi:hypothetical protein
LVTPWYLSAIRTETFSTCCTAKPRFPEGCAGGAR